MNKLNTKEKIDQISHEARIWLKKTIIKEHPDWIDEKGNCPKCDRFYFNLAGLGTAAENN